MKLSRLYCNKPDVFGAVDFVPGLNVVMAEIRLPENKNKDTHNLGKTTLGRLLDFSFLAGRDPKFFLFKHLDLFKDFIFFLEIELTDASYLTVRRGVEEASKISFKKHEARYQDFSTMGDGGWDHFELPFDRAQEMLDSLLDWRALKPWGYRNRRIRMREIHRPRLVKMKSVLKRKKNSKTIRRVGELMQDVLDSFGWYGIGSSLAESSAEETAEEPKEAVEAEVEGEEADNEEYVEPEYYFDPADVQGAVDEAISTLIKEGLVPEFSNPKNPPELAEIFAVLFGPKSEIREQIEYFEELISGYEDRAHIDDLKEAYGILESVVEKISPKKPKA